jgi:hypothetical protein
MSSPRFSDFLRIQEVLLLEVMDLVKEAGEKIALPSQIVYVSAEILERVGVGAICRSSSDEHGARPRSKRTLSKPLADRTAGAS